MLSQSPKFGLRLLHGQARAPDGIGRWDSQFGHLRPIPRQFAVRNACISRQAPGAGAGNIRNICPGLEIGTEIAKGFTKVFRELRRAACNRRGKNPGNGTTARENRS